MVPVTSFVCYPQISQKGYSLNVCPRKERDTKNRIAEKLCWF